MSMVRVGAIIWTSSRLPEMLEFYSRIGIPLEPDTHKRDATHIAHYEADIDGIHYAVFEKDSSTDDEGNEAATLVGFAVEDIAATLQLLNDLNPKVKKPLEETPWGKRIVILDPDGRSVELYQEPD